MIHLTVVSPPGTSQECFLFLLPEFQRRVVHVREGQNTHVQSKAVFFFSFQNRELLLIFLNKI